VAASDYLKVLPSAIGRWLPGRLTALGTDGFGRSDGRDALRQHFEVAAADVVVAALSALAAEGAVEAKIARQAMKELDVSPEKIDPRLA
jgi:pyruvate dehydrogenase E1 component